mmetsp:Transcript_2064/g.4599  ORF Transcript_2064/g.4599 Transcript_2064/m.4599 type:complete len:295 (-) Transcript_2064:94-978(-)
MQFLIYGLSAWNLMSGTAALSAVPGENPLKVLDDEMHAAKHFLEPLESVLHDLGEGISSSKKAPHNYDALAVRPPIAVLSLKSAEPRMMVNKAPAFGVTEEEGAVANVDAMERKRLKLLVEDISPEEMALQAKLIVPQALGSKLSEWCDDEPHKEACRYQNLAQHYCGLLRQAVPALLDTAEVKTVALGILEDEVTSSNVQVASFLEMAGGSNRTDDTALWDSLVDTPAFKKKLGQTCWGLETVHPGCREVTKETVYCQVIARAALALVDTERLATQMISAFSSNPALQRQLVS